MIEINLYPLEIRYRQRGLRRARMLSASSMRAGVAISLSLAAITYVVIASLGLRIRRNTTLSDLRVAHGTLYAGVAGERQEHRDRIKVGRMHEYARRVGDFLALLERSTVPGVSFSQLVTQHDGVALRGETADMSSLQALISYFISEMSGCSVTTESIREVSDDHQRGYKQFSVKVTILPDRN